MCSIQVFVEFVEFVELWLYVLCVVFEDDEVVGIGHNSDNVW